MMWFSGHHKHSPVVSGVSLAASPSVRSYRMELRTLNASQHPARNVLILLTINDHGPKFTDIVLRFILGYVCMYVCPKIYIRRALSENVTVAPRFQTNRCGVRGSLAMLDLVISLLILLTAFRSAFWICNIVLSIFCFYNV